MQAVKSFRPIRNSVSSSSLSLSRLSNHILSTRKSVSPLLFLRPSPLLCRNFSEQKQPQSEQEPSPAFTVKFAEQNQKEESSLPPPPPPSQAGSFRAWIEDGVASARWTSIISANRKVPFLWVILTLGGIALWAFAYNDTSDSQIEESKRKIASGDEKLKNEGLEHLRDICHINGWSLMDFTPKLVEHGVLEIFVQQAKSNSMESRLHALMALQLLASRESAKPRLITISQALIDAVLDNIQSDDPRVRTFAFTTLIALTNSKNFISKFSDESLELIVNLLRVLPPVFFNDRSCLLKVIANLSVDDNNSIKFAQLQCASLLHTVEKQESKVFAPRNVVLAQLRICTTVLSLPTEEQDALHLSKEEWDKVDAGSKWQVPYNAGDSEYISHIKSSAMVGFLWGFIRGVIRHRRAGPLPFLSVYQNAILAPVGAAGYYTIWHYYQEYMQTWQKDKDLKTIYSAGAAATVANSAILFFFFRFTPFFFFPILSGSKMIDE